MRAGVVSRVQVVRARQELSGEGIDTLDEGRDAEGRAVRTDLTALSRANERRGVKISEVHALGLVHQHL